VSKDFKGLILNGDPIDEPIEAYGPFVMNTKQEINEAISDFQNGKMGRL
jgi:redox-sensitive bicupin YhaK (pirin superfamily)